MTTMHEHIRDQQKIAHNLCGIMEALVILDNEGCAPGAVTSLLSVGRDLADRLGEGLDSVNLPEVTA